MKDRIRQIMEDQHLNQQNFAQLIGKSTATLSSIFNDRTKPSLDIVDAIKKKLPQVNLEWLLYGTPPMYINKVEGAQAGASARGGNGADEDSLDMYGDAVGVAGTGASAAGMGGSHGGIGGAGGVVEPTLDFGGSEGSDSPTSPSLFDHPQTHGVKRTPKISPMQRLNMWTNRSVRLPRSASSTMIRPGRLSFRRNRLLLCCRE